MMRQVPADRNSEQRRFIRWLGRDERLAAGATNMARERQKLKQHPRVAQEATGAGDVVRSRFPVNHARRRSDADTNAGGSRLARTFPSSAHPFCQNYIPHRPGCSNRLRRTETAPERRGRSLHAGCHHAARYGLRRWIRSNDAGEKKPDREPIKSVATPSIVYPTSTAGQNDQES